MYHIFLGRGIQYEGINSRPCRTMGKFMMILHLACGAGVIAPSSYIIICRLSLLSISHDIIKDKRVSSSLLNIVQIRNYANLRISMEYSQL